jgi:uncharacterized protein (TIGR03067 family)
MRRPWLSGTATLAPVTWPPGVALAKRGLPPKPGAKMPSVRLLVRTGFVLEELPQICVECGAEMILFHHMTVQIQGIGIPVRLPLCHRHRNRRFSNHAEGAQGPALSALASYGGLVGMAAVAAYESNRGNAPTYSILIDDACPKFIRELEVIRRREVVEFDRNLRQSHEKPVDALPSDEPAEVWSRLPASSADAEKTSPRIVTRPVTKRARGPLFWFILGSVALVMLGTLVAAGVTTGLAWLKRTPPRTERTITRQEREEEEAKWQGTWSAVSGESSGENLPPQSLANVKVVVEGVRFVLHRGQGKEAEMSFTINPAENPKALDGTPVSGNAKGKTLPGIYRIEEDTLTICLNPLLGGARPNSFTTKPDSPNVLYVFKRVR